MSKLFFTVLILSFSQSFATGSIPYYLKRKSAADFVKGEVIVKFKDQTSSQTALNILKNKNSKFLAKLGTPGLLRVKIKEGQDVETAVEEYKNNPNVEYAQPNFIYRANAIPNDPSFGQLWGLKNSGQTIVASNGPDTPESTNNPGTSGNDMDLPEAWDRITDCSSVLVAVLDSGVNYNQADLANNMWNGGASYPNHGYDFVDSDNDPMDKNGHGTHVAGTIGAVGNNSVGISGVCWTANIMALRVLDAAGSGSTANIISAINFAIANSVKVMNMSLGISVADTAFQTAITNANNAGIIFIVAAGNDNENNDSGTTPSYPCNYTNSNIVCVAALDQAYSLASFSNYGSTSVDVAAPGVNILSAWPGTHATTSDALTSGWSGSTTTSGGWVYKALNFGVLTNTLVNPASYDYSTAAYKNSTDDRAWKSFNLAGADGATVDFYAMYDTEPNNDAIGVYASSSSGDPVSSGSLVDAYTGSTDGSRYLQTVDISDFVSATTTIGFRLLTDSSVVSYGVNISLFSTTKLTLNNTTYNVIAGTSMAAPHVAGLAAMIWAYNSNYTAADVIASIKSGGDTLSILASTTVTGKAVNAQGSLAYITTPDNLSVVKQ